MVIQRVVSSALQFRNLPETETSPFACDIALRITSKLYLIIVVLTKEVRNTKRLIYAVNAACHSCL